MEPSVTKRTLVVPAIAIGNVGQIAIELLANQLASGISPEYLDSKGCILPCVGNVKIVQHGQKSSKVNLRFASSFELHKINEQVSLLQIRSMVVPGKSKKFAQLIAEFAKDRKFDRILVLGGVSALALINDEQLTKTRHLPRFFTSGQALDEQASQAGFLPLEYKVEELKLSGLLPYLVEAGQSASVDISAILMYIFEGDNWNDGMQMAKFAASSVGLSGIVTKA
jgi:hypothetical protein